MGLGIRTSHAVALLWVLSVTTSWAQVHTDHVVRCLEVSSDDGTTTTCICQEGSPTDRLFHDTNCDRTKDSGEVYIDLPLNAAEDSAGSISNLSGLELTATDALALLQGCADNEILKWNETGGLWECAADAGAAGGISNILEDVTPQLGGDLDANAFDIQFDDADRKSVV